LETEFEAKYAHSALIWFTARHQAKCDGTISEFVMEKPPRNFAERMSKASEAIGETMDPKKAEMSAADFSLKLDTGAANLASKFSLMRSNWKKKREEKAAADKIKKEEKDAANKLKKEELEAAEEEKKKLETPESSAENANKVSDEKKFEDENNDAEDDHFNVGVDNEDNIYDKLVPEAIEERAREDLAN